MYDSVVKIRSTTSDTGFSNHGSECREDGRPFELDGTYLSIYHREREEI